MESKVCLFPIPGEQLPFTRQEVNQDANLMSSSVSSLFMQQPAYSANSVNIRLL